MFAELWQTNHKSTDDDENWARFLAHQKIKFLFTTFSTLNIHILKNIYNVYALHRFLISLPFFGRKRHMAMVTNFNEKNSQKKHFSPHKMAAFIQTPIN